MVRQPSTNRLFYLQAAGLISRSEFSFSSFYARTQHHKPALVHISHPFVFRFIYHKIQHLSSLRLGDSELMSGCQPSSRARLTFIGRNTLRSDLLELCTTMDPASLPQHQFSRLNKQSSSRDITSSTSRMRTPPLFKVFLCSTFAALCRHIP
jgi:hypothetical protein